MNSNNSYRFFGSPNVRPQYNKCAWSFAVLPWTSNPEDANIVKGGGGIMEFKGSNSKSEQKFNIHCKRKTDTESHIPTKHIITEDKMIAHLQKLHITNDDKSHRNTDKNQPSIDIPNFNVDMSQFDLEKKLKNARTIRVCEEVRKLHNPDSIIPKSLLNRIEKPCTALVLWQPPQNLQDMRYSNSNEPIEEEYDNNNSSNLDLNNFCMDLDI